GLEPATVREVARRYGEQAPTATRAELAALAARAIDQHQIPIGETLSAAETLLGLAESVSLCARTGSLPESTVRREVLGPIVAPPLAPEAPTLTVAQLGVLAEELLAAASSTGFLAAALTVDGRPLGLGSLFGAFAEAYSAMSRGDPEPAMGRPVTAWPRYPAVAVPLGEHQRLCLEDPIVRPGLSTDASALHTRLQTWTLKPAQRH